MHPALLVLAFAAVASAKTDYGGCVSVKTTNQWGEASRLWYVPTDGEICELLDCGGGRAPPKTTVPGCNLYEGTATYSPKYLAGFNAASTGASPSAAATTTTAESSPAVTSAATTSTVASSTSVSSTEPATSLTSSIAASSISSAASLSTTAAAGATSTSSSGTSTVAGQPAGNSTSSGSPATSSTLTPVNAGSVKSVGVVSALMGVVAAGFAFLL